MTVADRSWAEKFAARTRGGVGGGLASILALAGDKKAIPFAGGFPDPSTFPEHELTDLVRGIIDANDSSALQYAPTGGLPGPLDYISGRLGANEGRTPTDGELMITSGTIEALELAGKAFLDPGDLVMVEAPTYLGAIMAFKSFQADLEALPMDEGGLQIEALEASLADGRIPKLLYTIPDHQNPGGVSLVADRRERLVELARRYGFVIVEDVAYRELSFHGATGACLWALGPDVVVQAGTFSKLFFPGVRLGWAAGPPEIVSQLVLAKQNTDQCAGALGQRLLEDYGRRGLLDRQIELSCELYRQRCDLMLAALGEHMPNGVSWTRPRGGFFSWVTLPPGLDAAELAVVAQSRGVTFVPGAPFFPDGRGADNLRLSYSRVEDHLISEGVRRLAAVIEESTGRLRGGES